LSTREEFIAEKIADAAIIVIYGINTYLLKSIMFAKDLSDKIFSPPRHEV
jgi:hypothetical protein